MKSKVSILTKFCIIMLGALMPVFAFGQVPPPPPPEGIPFDMVSGVLLAGAALYHGTKSYLRKGAAA